MRFKRIYLEITNICNLSCPFCPKNDRDKKNMNEDNFKLILTKLKNYTKYLNFHLMGEPLMHPKINEYINIASQDYKINITTNGYLIDKIKNNKSIHQLNISLQAFDQTKNKELVDYLNTIIDTVNVLKKTTIINYRIWVEDIKNSQIIKLLEAYYKTKINGNTKLEDNVYIDFAKEFIWPNLNNNYYQEKGSCMGLRNHIGILVDGTIVPCCLDYNANLKLGNIFNDDLEAILQSDKVIKMINNFKNNKKCQELCRHCNFYDRIIEEKRDNHE